MFFVLQVITVKVPITAGTMVPTISHICMGLALDTLVVVELALLPKRVNSRCQIMSTGLTCSFCKSFGCLSPHGIKYAKFNARNARDGGCKAADV